MKNFVYLTLLSSFLIFSTETSLNKKAEFIGVITPQEYLFDARDFSVLNERVATGTNYNPVVDILQNENHIVGGMDFPSPHAIARANDRIHIGPNVLVNDPEEDDVFVETSLAANPTEPSNLIVGALALNASYVQSTEGPGPSPKGAWLTSVFTSFDGGETWRESPLAQLYDFDHTGDPWVAFGPEGTAYFATLVTDEQFIGSENASAIAIFRSEDGGATWSEPSLLPFGDPVASYDHVVLDVDRSDGPHRGSLYIGATAARRDDNGWAIQAPTVIRSDDQARTFPTIWREPQTNLLGGMQDLKVLPDGAVVALFGDGARKLDKQGGRVDFTAPRRTKAFISRDGGRSFSAGYIATFAQTVGQWDDAGVDRSDGPFAGRMYYTWAQSMQGDTQGVNVLASDDGQMWSEPLRIAPKNQQTWVRVSAVAVNNAGVVGVLWHQRVDDTDPVEQYTNFAVSWDGGETFSAPVRVSDAPSYPESEANGMAASRFPGGGDYVGLAASSDGAFHAAWGDARSGKFQIYAARIEVDGKASKPSE